MITLNDLLEIAEVRHMTIYAPVTPRVDTRIDFDPGDDAMLCDVCQMYGHFRVKRISPAFKGDARMVVWLERTAEKEG